MSRLEDAENLSRRSNLRVRGLPETITDLQSTITIPGTYAFDPY